MKKLQTLVPVVALALGVACNKQEVTPKTEDDKTFYAMGSLMGTRLKSIDLKDAEMDMIVQGLRDSAKGKESTIDLAKYRGQVQNVFRKRMEKNTEKYKAEGKSYVDKYIAGGGKKSDKGFAYKILKEGTGKKPQATDTVKVHYHGTLIDGKVFDSSVERGKEVSFPLNRVIKCWTEGMQLVGVGGKIQLVCPSELAYGEHGAPPKIPGGSTLIFDVELFSIEDGKTKTAKNQVKAKAKK